MSQEKKEIMKNFFMDYYNEATHGDGNPSDKLAKQYYKDYRGKFPWTQDLGTLETYMKLFKSKEIGDVAREDYFHTLTEFHRSLSSPIVEPEPEPEPELSPPVIRRVDDTPVIRLSPTSSASASASSSSSLNSDKSSSSPLIVGSALDMLKEEEKQHISQLVKLMSARYRVIKYIDQSNYQGLKNLYNQLTSILRKLEARRKDVGHEVWGELMRLDLQGLLDKARSASVRVPDRDIKDISGLRAGHGWSSEEIPKVEEEMKKNGLVALISARILSSKADPDASPRPRAMQRADAHDADRHELSRARKNQKKKKKKSHKKKKSKKSRKSKRRKHTKRRR